MALMDLADLLVQKFGAVDPWSELEDHRYGLGYDDWDDWVVHVIETAELAEPLMAPLSYADALPIYVNGLP